MCSSDLLGGRNRYSTLLQDLVRYRDQGAVPDPQWFAQVREILLEHEKQEESVLNVQNKRQNIIREINSVEKHYVASLQTTVNSFQTPLEEEKLISSEQSEVLFSSLRTIRDDHQKFYSLLKSNLTSRSLGEVFTKLENSLHGYSQYMANYSQAAQLIAQLETQEPFIAFMKRPALRKKIGTFTLLDFLIRPVQQVPRYSMLLSQLQTVTPTGMNQTTTNRSFFFISHHHFFCISFSAFFFLSFSLFSLSLDHSDYQPLTAALNRVREIAIALNESSSRSENVAAIKAIQTKINQGHSRMRQAGLINLMSEPDRFFTFEADLLWPTTQRRKTRWVQLHCFLFSDVLIGVTSKEASSDDSSGPSPVSASLKYKVALPLRFIEILSRSTIAKPFPEKTMPDSTWTGDWLNLKALEYSGDNFTTPAKTRLLSLITRDSKENRQWRHFLQTALTRISNSPATHAEMIKNRTIVSANAF